MSLQRKKREPFSCIVFGFFGEHNFEITNMEIKDIKFDLSTQRDNLELINSSLNLLPTDAWVLCQVIKVNTDHTFIDIKILISGKFKINQDDFPKIMLVDYVKKLHLVSGDLTNILLNNHLFLNKKFKSEGIIGLAFISVKKLKEFTPNQNLLKFFPNLLPQEFTPNQNLLNLLDLLPEEVLVDKLLSQLSEKKLLQLRLTSSELRKLADLKRTVVFQNIPEDFDYTQRSIELYCNIFGKNPNDCILCLNLNFKVKDSEYETPAIEWNRNLIDSTIKIQLKISCRTFCTDKRNFYDNTYRNQKLDIMHECISSLKNIVSLDINFAGNWLIKVIGNKFLTSFSQSNITSLKISDVYLLWKPFLHSMKNLKSLKELILTNVILLDNLSSISEDDSEDETYNPEEFNEDFINSLSGIESFGICGDSVFDSDSNIEDDNPAYVVLIRKVLPLLKDLPLLRSLQLENKPINRHLSVVPSFSGEYQEREMQDMDHLAPELSTLTELTSLNLSNSNLDFEREVETLSRSILRNLNNITSLNLANTQLNGRNLSILIPTIRSLPQLTYLNVSNNMLSKRAIENLTQELKLTELNTENNVWDEAEEEEQYFFY